ncbi:MAG: hypothetical protein SFV23_08210 [Planctomycetaceae bacterium]|nr:hypothetical protein [Planctomycetaceae bacterium]
MIIPYAELWFLELAGHYGGGWFAFHFLHDTNSDRKIGLHQQYNLPINGLTPRQIGEVLFRLWENKEVLFTSGRVQDDEYAPYTPDCAEEIAQLVVTETILWRKPRHERSVDYWNQPQHCYAITSSGFARWEAYAEPNWDKFRGEFTGQLSEAGETIWKQTATTTQFAIEVLCNEASRIYPPALIDWDSLTTQWMTPWNICPEKSLPTGVTVSVRVTEFEQVGITPDLWELVGPTQDEAYRQFREICHWYEHGLRDHPDRPLRH